MLAAGAAVLKGLIPVEFHYLPLVGFPNLLAPIIGLLHGVLTFIYHGVHNYGWSLIILALLVKAIFWPLNSMQYKSMLKTQLIAPQLKALQAKYKGDKERLNAETMALYKETGANPLASCLPLLLQMPILFSLYAAINGDKALFASQTWLWIGSSFASAVPKHILASSLAAPDYFLLVLYIISMYFSVKFTSPAVDPAAAQQQKIMSFVSPAMVGYMGFRFAWPSALIIYWLSFNVFTMAQQIYLMRRYPRPALAGGAVAVAPAARGATAKNVLAGAAAKPPARPSDAGTGSRTARRRRSRR